MDIQELFKDSYNIVDYVRSRTATFKESPLTEVDALVLCQLFYAKIEKVLDGDCVSRIDSRYEVRDFWKNEYVADVFADDITDEENMELFAAAAASRRFRNLVVKNVVSESSLDKQAQFAAACFEISDDEDFVCFRGTDGSIIGWKEDFNMSFMSSVPAQKDSVDYMNRFCGADSEDANKKLYLGGHSKGGNLAFYAAARCKEEIRNRIKEVFSLDSPGFRNEVYEELMAMPGVSEIKVNKIVPQSSVIGLLMQHQEEYNVIRSKAIGGLFQHSAYTWQLENGSFQPHTHLTRESLRIERTIDDWLQSVSDEQRELFINTLFGIIIDNNIETVYDLKHISPRTVANMIGDYADLDHDTRRIIRKTIHNLARASFDQL